MSGVLHITVEPSTPLGQPSQTQQHWIHPSLSETVDPIKGRQFRALHAVRKGECLLIDRPYAVIPVVDDPCASDALLCSNSACNRRTAPDTGRISCMSNCLREVVWCNENCRDADRPRHDFECTWLKRYAGPIRAKWGEYDFGMLWVIVRMLATRHVEFGSTQHAQDRAWDAIERFCGSEETWSHDQVRSWSTLVKKYLQDSLVLPHGMSAQQILALICKEEANSFGLYPQETGMFPPPRSSTGRGEQFAAAVYPRAAVANHSCCPNIVHKPDDQSRMVFTASRDISPGEECCIAYFDLTQLVQFDCRRDHLRTSFRFVCQCERCVDEEPPNNNSQWCEMPLMDE